MANERVTEAIPTYLSHSYRAEDRKLNHYFWELLWQGGFLVQVDPRSDDPRANIFSIPYLELMMQRSACFVAVIPLRQEQLRDRCSPYILWEYGLAVQSKKSRVVFVEEGVAGRYFPTGRPGMRIGFSNAIFPRRCREQCGGWSRRSGTAHARLVAARRGVALRGCSNAPRKTSVALLLEVALLAAR
jgi:hypothetical protein